MYRVEQYFYVYQKIRYYGLLAELVSKHHFIVTMFFILTRIIYFVFKFVWFFSI